MQTDGDSREKSGCRGQEGGWCPTLRSDGVTGVHVSNTKMGVLNVHFLCQIYLSKSVEILKESIDTRVTRRTACPSTWGSVTQP